MLARLRAEDPEARPLVDTEYRLDSIQYPFEEIRREGTGQAKAFVTIIEGCNHRCTYCIVPTTRGREVCRDLEDVLAEVRVLAARGVIEVEFLGQTVNAYRDGRGHTLADLLRAAAGIDGLRRVRFTTSHPAQMTDALIEAMADARPPVCPYLHLPVQSGSSEVLRAMRRGYDRDGYLRKIEALRKKMPSLHLGTDVIVGYPGEREQDFEATLSLLGEVGFHTVYSFTYSPRPGTQSSELADDVPPAAKLERLGRLQHHQKVIQATLNQAWVGREVEVLVEGTSRRDPTKWTGRTPENRVVNFTGPAEVGRLVPVTIASATAFSLGGKAFA
jgi:tRNA-2-methylthio-N6-dimethylallyladenosine synthase